MSCQKCNISVEAPQWDCICDLLIENGNCPECLCIPSKCRCNSQDRPSTPEGHRRVVYFFTEFLVDDMPEMSEAQGEK